MTCSKLANDYFNSGLFKVSKMTYDLSKVSKMTNYYDLFKVSQMSNYFDLFKVCKMTNYYDLFKVSCA